MMKKILCAASLMYASHVTAAVFDLTAQLSPRLEQGCQSRGSVFDFHDEIDDEMHLKSSFKNQVAQHIEDGSQTSWGDKYVLKNAQYHGVKVKSIEFVTGRSKDRTQWIVFDIRTPEAKAKFNQIKFNRSQQPHMAPEIEKTSKEATVYCYIGNPFG